MTANRKASVSRPNGDPFKGLFRTSLAGPGHTLHEAFLNLERLNQVERVARHESRDLFGGRINLSPDEGQGWWDFMRFRRDVYVIAGDFVYKDPRVEMLSGDGLVQFYFKLSGDLTMAITRSESLRLAQPGLLIYHQPPGVEVSEWTAPNSHERFVSINILPEALIDIFALNSQALPRQLAAVINRERSNAVFYSQLSLSATMFELANRLVDNPFTDALGLLYSESLTMQLICLLVGSLDTLSNTPNEQYSPREVRCLHAARKVLMNQLSHPPTIRQLARAAGINETTLKKGFKALFGETIFDFSVRCRMQHALLLLRGQRVPVAEVGEAVGYRHQTSFATAFRRHFGMRPKDARSSRPD